MKMSKRDLNIDREDLESEYDFGAKQEQSSSKRLRRDDELWKKAKPGEIAPPGRSKAPAVFDEEHSRLERQKRRLMTLDVYSRHKELINQYYLFYPGATAQLQRDTSRDRTDIDFLKDNHQFLWDDDQLSQAAQTSWQARLAKRYYDKLFKEYCIADLSQYKMNRIAMRWRIEKEVKSGKGQFECGNKKCTETNDLSSWEVNFSYIEKNEKKNALVKLRLCPECSKKLNYHSKRKKVDKRGNKASRKKRLSTTENSESSTSDPSVAEKSPKVDAKLEGDDSEDKSKELKQRADEMMQVWRKADDDVDPQKLIEQDLDDFLDEMLL